MAGDGVEPPGASSLPLLTRTPSELLPFLLSLQKEEGLPAHLFAF